MKRQKLKETSFLGAALAMSVAGIEMPAYAAEMPKTSSGITMTDFGEIQGFGSTIEIEQAATAKSGSKKGSKKGSSKKGGTTTSTSGGAAASTGACSSCCGGVGGGIAGPSSMCVGP